MSRKFSTSVHSTTENVLPKLLLIDINVMENILSDSVNEQ